MLIDQLFETAKDIGSADEFNIIRQTDDSRTINFIIEKTLEHLDRVGVDLDTPNLSQRDKFVQLQQPIAAAIEWAILTAAREEFADFETTNAVYPSGTIDSIVDRIRGRLAQVGKDLAALDESGGSTIAQMEKRLKAAYKRTNLISARDAFSNFETGDYFSPDDSFGTQSFYNLAWISIPLENSEEAITALDESGKSSAAQINKRLETALRRAQLITARQEFLRFEVADVSDDTTTDQIGETVKNIIERLKSAGASDYAALDESGKSTGLQIQERLMAAIIRANLIVARKIFARLETQKNSLDPAIINWLVKKIRERLTYIGKTSADLDELGKSTDAQMEERIEAGAKRANLNSARRELDYLETGKYFYNSDHIISTVKKIREFLTAGDWDITALDESGKSSAAQMKKRIGAAYKRASLVLAREEFSIFETETRFDRQPDFDSDVNNIRKNLKHARKSVADLDESGNSTDAQMEDRIEAAVKRANLIAARREFSNFERHGVFHASVKETIERIRNRVERAGETLASLDESGQSSVEQIEQRIRAATKPAYLAHARKRFSWLKEVASSHRMDLASIQETVGDIRQGLENAGHNAAALDETGKSNARRMEEQMETVFQRARKTADRNAKRSKPNGGIKLSGTRGKGLDRGKSPAL